MQRGGGKGEKICCGRDGAVICFGVICLGLYIFFMTEVLFSLTVTFFTVFYHFAMGIIVGSAVTLCRQNKTDTALFEIGDTERVFYDKIKLKKWKKHALTYNPKLFSLKSNSYSELMHNMNNSRIGHEIIVLLSFVPIVFSVCIGGAIPFIITSVAFAAAPSSITVTVYSLPTSKLPVKHSFCYLPTRQPLQQRRYYLCCLLR